MKNKCVILMVSTVLALVSCTNGEKSGQENVANEVVTESILPFKLYPTENMWTFIKLDTRNGRMWQVQYSIKEESSRLEVPLNPISLSPVEHVDQFVLYPTKNIYNFILLDRISGNTWQVQWSFDENNRVIIPIESQQN